MSAAVSPNQHISSGVVGNCLLWKRLCSLLVRHALSYIVIDGVQMNGHFQGQQFMFNHRGIIFEVMKRYCNTMTMTMNENENYLFRH